MNKKFANQCNEPLWGGCLLFTTFATVFTQMGGNKYNLKMTFSAGIVFDKSISDNLDTATNLTYTIRLANTKRRQVERERVREREREKERQTE